MFLLNSNYRNPQKGISLIELMIAMVLGLFLVWGVMQSFLTSRQSYRLQQGLGRIQENGRLAQEFLGYEIRNAGDYGCVNGDDFVTDHFDDRNDALATLNGTDDCATLPGTIGINMITADIFSTAFEYAVYGFNDVAANATVGTAPDQITLKNVPKLNSDVLVLRLADELGVLTAKTEASTPAAVSDLSGVTLTVNTDLPALAADQPLVISDCSNIKIFAASEITTASLPTSDFTLSASNFCAQAAFEQGASVRKLSTVYYFVAASSTGTNFSLYRQEGDGATSAEELLEGVDDMQLQYGVDTDGDGIADVWRTADAVSAAEWNGWDFVDDPDGDGSTADKRKDNNLVRAVRYSLLLRTDDAVLNDTQTLTYNGASVDYTDRIMRQVFTSSVGIRSRIK